MAVQGTPLCLRRRPSGDLAYLSYRAAVFTDLYPYCWSLVDARVLALQEVVEELLLNF